MDDPRELKKYALLVATLSAFLTPFMGSAINLAVPAIGREFQLEAVMLNWIVTSFLVASAVFLLPFGRAADLYGRKKVFLAGMIIYAFFSLLSGLATSGEALLLFRVFNGIGGAMIFGTSMAILTSIFPPAERGRVLGLNVAAVYTGLSLGPVAGGFLTHYLGWRYIFFLNVILGVLVVLVAFSKLRGEWREARGEGFDPAGAVLYSLGMTAFMVGMATVNTIPQGRWIFLLGLLLLAWFVWQEMRYRYPLLNINLFRNVVFAFSNLAALINYSSTFAVGFLLSLYLQVAKGLDAQVAGFILLSQPVLMALLSPRAGRLSDRVEPRILSSIGMGLTFVGLCLLIFLRQATPLWVVVGDLVLLGIGFALFSSPNTNAVMSAVEKRYYGVASATLGTMRLVGQALSMALVTLFFTFYFKGLAVTAATSPLLLQSMRVSFIIFAVLCAGGVFASLARGRVREKEGV